MRKMTVLLLAIVMFAGLRADEGMWMLPLIEKLNIQKMNGMGCTLSAEEIYSDKNVSLKDAVIVFGNGCTGVVVSDKGLVFTNHHCGFGAIQQLSSMDHNYLKNGFTAEKQEDEIYAPDLTIKFLVKIEDVTERVISQLPDELNGKQRKTKQDSILTVIKNEAEKGTHFKAQVKSFYSGNEFYTFVFEEFTDIRFAYAPPSSIGKFGGDTDNWMWPRHTGDFSVFRVYSDSNGKPAPYSIKNIPYTPKRFAAISNQGYKPDDYTMIMGNPGTTTRYLSSWGIENRMNAGNQARIDVRGAKQDVWKSFMRVDESIQLAYASKYARSSNYWKNSIGMNNALEKLHVIDNKKGTELKFTEWVNQNSDRKMKYGKVLESIEQGYKTLFPLTKTNSYLRESLFSGAEMPRMASQLERISKKGILIDSLLKEAREVYKDYNANVDEATFAVMLESYKNAVDASALPEFYKIIDKKFKGDFQKYAKWIYTKSAFTTFEKYSKAVTLQKINYANDPALVFWDDVNNAMRNNMTTTYTETSGKLADAERLYEKGLKEMAAENGTVLHPDANSTMRLTYGKVAGYNPADAIKYNYYTTTRGIIEKEKAGDYEFDVPVKLKDAIVKKDFGSYIDTKTGEMHVAFLSNNDITGGNSGSPIFNAKGELLGLAFDGNWEAMSGDIVFEPDLQRTISVDIRYVLFVMDKVGAAKRLIDELTIK